MLKRIYFPIMVIAFAVFFLLLSTQIPEANNRNDIGAAGWPQMVLGLMLVFGILLFIKEFVGYKKELATAKVSEVATEEEPVVEESMKHRQWYVLITIALLAIVIRFIGFTIAAALFIAAAAFLIGKKNWIVIALVAILASIALTLLFSTALSLALPQGVGIFRIFNVWLSMLFS